MSSDTQGSQTRTNKHKKGRIPRPEGNRQHAAAAQIQRRALQQELGRPPPQPNTERRPRAVPRDQEPHQQRSRVSLAQNLPVKPLVLIISLLVHNRKRRQNRLREYCLISRSWYEAGIILLYERPAIRRDKFDRFAETVLTHKQVKACRRLTDPALFVRHLDLGDVVHPERKVVLQVLQRVGNNLLTYTEAIRRYHVSNDLYPVPPSISPLSKCRRLRTIDLFSMSGEIRYDQVIRAIENMQDLSTLAFPQETRFFDRRENTTLKWPSNLRHVTFSGQFPWNMRYGLDSVASAWPPTLQQVALNGCYTNHHIITMALKLEQNIQSVCIHDRGAKWYFPSVVADLANVKHLSVPADIAGTDYRSFTTPCTPRLEKLELRAETGRGLHYFRLDDVVRHAEAISSLVLIRLHCSFLQASPPFLEQLIVAHRILRSRAQKRNEEAGRMVFKQEDCGVVIWRSRSEFYSVA